MSEGIRPFTNKFGVREERQCMINEIAVDYNKEEIKEQLSFYEFLFIPSFKLFITLLTVVTASSQNKHSHAKLTFRKNERTKGHYLGIDSTSAGLAVLTKPLEDDERLLYDFVREEKPEGQRDGRNLLQCCNIAASIAEQLADFHEMGVIHGSLSSLSIAISKLSHRVRLRNFGLTKVKEEYYNIPEKQYVPFDKEKMKILDPHNFMPPEIFWSYLHIERPKLKKHTDVFSFGLLLWEIFEGGFVHFYPSDILSRHSLIKKEQERMKAKGVSFSSLPLLFFDQNYFTNTPKEVQEVIYNCISEDPFSRCSMRAIAMKLRSICKYNLELDLSLISIYLFIYLFICFLSISSFLFSLFFKSFLSLLYITFLFLFDPLN